MFVTSLICVFDIICLALLSWGTAAGARSLTISMLPPSEAMVEGQNVTLTCLVSGAQHPATINWFNGTNLGSITADGQEVIEEESPEGSFYTTRTTYTFLAAKHDHGVRVRCRGRNDEMERRGEESLEDSIKLDVYFTPRVTLKPSGMIRETFTNNLTLHCNYEAYPENLTKVTWLLDGKKIVDYSGFNSTDLHLDSIGYSDQGNYSCQLTNIVGTGTSTTHLLLEVYHPPVVKVGLSSKLIYEHKHMNVTLKCNVIAANPPGTTGYQWLHNGETLYQTTEPEYVLTEVDRFDTGQYSCRGRSTLGWGDPSEEEEMTVHYPPSPATIHYYPETVVKGKPVILFCEVTDFGQPPSPTYKWFLNGMLIRNETQSKLNVEWFPSLAFSNYSCNAVNEVGNGELAHIVVPVMAPPTFLQELPLWTGVHENSTNVSLTCRVECQPRCYVHWQKDGKLIDQSDFGYNIKKFHTSNNEESNILKSVQSTLEWNWSQRQFPKLIRGIDDGNYTCVASGNLVGTKVTSTTMFEVEYAPENTRLSLGDMNVTHGDVIGTILCSSDAVPPPSYIWTFGDIVLSKYAEFNYNYALIKERSGNYTCTAYNRHGNDSRNIFINVMYKPECEISTHFDIDGRVTISCEFSANPIDIDVKWLLDNITLTEDVILDEVDLRSSVSFLHSEFHHGKYQCIANNSIGESQPCIKDFTKN